MDAPVEELGAPAEPLGHSGAPDLGSGIHLGQSQRATPEMGGCGRPNVLATPQRGELGQYLRYCRTRHVQRSGPTASSVPPSALHGTGHAA
jgi:hypothetical protein